MKKRGDRMTNEEAKEILAKARDEEDVVFDFPKFSEALTIGIRAIEKQMPKKPDDIVFNKICGWVKGKCPVCGFVVFKPYGCQKCLNAMDWSE